MPVLALDEQKLEQALNNLIGNAVKFSYPESVVEVDIRRLGEEVVVSVRDHGQGIPAHETKQLFQPFATTSVRGTAGEKSTGLGLAITRKVVEGHGGRIWLESRVGEGSTFSFSLPLPKEPLTLTAAQLSPPATFHPKLGRTGAVTANSIRILLAEDNVINQRITLKLLEQVGYKADVVADGAAAVAALQHEPYDVILMDLYMPEMDGLEATRHIRRQDNAGSQPYIIAMTASNSPEDRQRCIAAGMDDYMGKPTPSRREELSAALARGVERDKVIG